MENLTVEIIRQTTEKYLTDYQIISGGRDEMTWEKWQDMFVNDYKKYWEVLKQKIIDDGLIGKTGEWQNGLLFKFSDGKLFGFTWRGWGDFMAAIVNKGENYMQYYQD